MFLFEENYLKAITGEQTCDEYHKNTARIYLERKAQELKASIDEIEIKAPEFTEDPAFKEMEEDYKRIRTGLDVKAE